MAYRDYYHTHISLLKSSAFFHVKSYKISLSFKLQDRNRLRTSNFRAEAKRSYIFLRFEAESVLKLF